MPNSFSEQDLRDVVAGKITVTCKDHLYTGRGPMPTKGCPKCIMALFVSWFSKVPADQFAAEVAAFSEVVCHMCEEEDQGILDYKPFSQPKIEYNKIEVQ